MIKKTVLISVSVLCAAFLASCAHSPSAPVTAPAVEYNAYIRQVLPALPRADVCHVVGPSETLWRIAKMYDVDMKEIVGANNLKDTTKLEMGQRLVIPRAAPPKPIVALYKTNKWKYIIIHHSATDVGNALDFYRAHRNRGWETLGYHFVIDDGSVGKQDGQVEVSPRWIKQLDGAHCNAGGMNHVGIGICLVGNFSKEQPTAEQMKSLAYLVDLLRKEYKIPAGNIMGHGQVPGASTECPGKYFPWRKFFSKSK